jgi:hypothetical protein
MCVTVPAMLAALQALVSNSKKHRSRHPLSLRGIVSDLMMLEEGLLPARIQEEEVSGVSGAQVCWHYPVQSLAVPLCVAKESAYGVNSGCSYRIIKMGLLPLVCAVPWAQSRVSAVRVW